MKYQYSILITIISILLIFLASCEYETITPKPIEVPDTVSFALNVMPIFDANCNASGCHSSGGISPDLTAPNAYVGLTFFGYVNTEEPEASSLYTKIFSGSMKDNASDQDREIILKWIQQGALDN